MCDLSAWPSLLLTGAVIAGIVLLRTSRHPRWTSATSTPTVAAHAGDDAAVEMLKNRFACGEIDIAEFESRLDSLLRTERSRKPV